MINMFGVWNSIQNHFKKSWMGYESKQDLIKNFEQYMNTVLIPENGIEDYQIKEFDNLWELFGFEIIELKK